jgi:type I restriction enzyme, S subunit
MSFPRYPSYKDSGIEWLGEVPEHWQTARLRWISKRYSGGTPDKLNLDYWADGTIPWLNSGAVNEPIITEPSAYITEEALLKSSAKWIPKGALVMALAGQGKTKGMVAQLTIKTTCNQSMAAIIATEEIEARFLYWWLVTNYQNIRNMAGGDLRDGLNLELLGNIPCPLLPYEEQQTIAAFLDRETAKIDALIAEQQRLIGLLKEKRQSVISHAVTKGLNPNALMKDSGIEWLGEVPNHWQTMQFKRLAAIQNGRDYKHIETNGTDGYPVIGSGGEFARATEYLFTGESVLLGRKGTIDKPLYINGSFWVVDTMFYTVVNTNAVPKYLYFCVLTIRFDLYSTSTAVPSMTQNDLGSIYFAIPDIEEQQTIAAFLDRETSKLDTLTTEAKTAITLLQERRTALISAAVTGKIDVRGLVSLA